MRRKKKKLKEPKKLSRIGMYDNGWETRIFIDWVYYVAQSKFLLSLKNTCIRRLWGHPLSTHAKFSEKLTFFTP